MATHSSVLTWDIPWTEESMGSKRVGHDWATKQQQQPELTKPSWVPPSNSSWTSNSFLTPMTMHYHHSSQVSRHQSCAMQFLSHWIWRCKKPSDTSLKLSSYLVRSLWDQLWAFRKPCTMSALHVGLLNECVIVKRPFPLLQWCWWWISLEEAYCQYICFDVGLALALVTYEDGGCMGKSLSHGRRGEFVSGSTMSSVLIGTQPLAGFHSGGDLPPRWTFIPLDWHASGTNSQLECNADPSMDIFPWDELNYTSRCYQCGAF